MMRHAFAVVGLLVVCSAASVSCSDSVVCGRGSIEVDGECIADTQLPVPTTCGTGTIYDEVSGECVNSLIEDELGRCGPSTVRVVGDDGIPVCEGVGACSDCSVAPACPQPSNPTRITVCGRVFDLETTLPMNNDPADPGILPDLSGKLYDPIAFINNPQTATVLAELEFDSCGYYQAEVALPFSGKIGLAIDDADGAADDNFVTVGVAEELAQGERALLNSFALRVTSDMAWTMMAGDPIGGDTFAQEGAYVPIYIDTSMPPVGPFEGTPKAGVKVAIGSSVNAANDFYFGDTDPLSRAMIDNGLDATGPNGTGILYGSPGINNNFTGIGPAGCDWPVNQAGMVGGAIFVQEREAECQ